MGMEALFTSSIPAGSGVSSSAALIVASTLAFLVVNGKLSSVTKGDLIGMSILNEKKVGVHSGGYANKQRWPICTHAFESTGWINLRLC